MNVENANNKMILNDDDLGQVAGGAQGAISENEILGYYAVLNLRPGIIDRLLSSPNMEKEDLIERYFPSVSRFATIRKFVSGKSESEVFAYLKGL